MDKIASSDYHLQNEKSRSRIDWWLFCAIIPILAAGLVTMHSFTDDNSFAQHQMVGIVVALVAFFVISFIDMRFLRSTWVSVTLFIASVSLLGALFFLGKVSHGAQSWFSIGSFSIQPSDFAKVALIIILAKYFSRRHIEIANVRHILVSGFYAFIIFALVLVNPDLGSAMIIAFVWLGMTMVSGISKKHLFAMIAI